MPYAPFALSQNTPVKKCVSWLGSEISHKSGAMLNFEGFAVRK